LYICESEQRANFTLLVFIITYIYNKTEVVIVEFLRKCRVWGVLQGV
jgi:hypothetical protein